MGISEARHTGLGERTTNPLPGPLPMRSEAGDLGDHIDDAVLCVPTLSAEQKA